MNWDGRGRRSRRRRTVSPGGEGLTLARRTTADCAAMSGYLTLLSPVDK
ncbi:hypothetical protein ACFFX0_29215 [Citricoccus parietis]|uniref:Uncharacterized protein n=1 Tax=Citricoccus parietis TaxID=592307 RepID=A0ABV5G9B7_9MICC